MSTTAPRYVYQSTLQYSTFVKRTVIEALQGAFKNHPDKTIAGTKVGINKSHETAEYPSVIVKLYEREMPNAGVGHAEYIQDPNSIIPQYIKYYHRLYKGDVEFAVYALSAVDRDVIRDGLVEVLAMQDVTTGGNAFIQRLYDQNNDHPYGNWHYPVLNLDLITGYGEQETMPAWGPEDALLYQVTYRVPIFGEFYSNTPVAPTFYGPIEEVDVYPWIPGTDAEPTDPPLGGDPNSLSGGYYKFTGWKSGTETI